MLNNKEWWKAALIRAVRTIAQTAIATIGTSVALDKVNWLAVLSASVLAGLLSMLTSLAGLPEVYDGTITVRAYEDYDEDGSPIVDGEHCEACDLSQYVGDNADGDH